jgi:methylase of polypeptide subunit release factors
MTAAADHPRDLFAAAAHLRDVPHASRADAILSAPAPLAPLLRSPSGTLTPHRCGLALEAIIAAAGSERRKTGAFYTPPWLVEHALDLCLDPILDSLQLHTPPHQLNDALLALRICDPACGTGNFLLAAAQRIAARSPSLPLDLVLSHCIFGVDINPDATRLCRAALASHASLPPDSLHHNIRTADAIRGIWPRSSHPAPGLDWNLAFAPTTDFHLVVGNPPYLNQLESATVQSRDAADHLRLASNGIITGYADLAAAFWLLASLLTKPAGRFALILPFPILSSRDARAVRTAIAQHSTITHLHAAPPSAFRASTRTCIIACQRESATTHHVAISSGNPRAPLPPLSIPRDSLAAAPTWSRFAAAFSGVPPITLAPLHPTLADIATATADFRDEYYGLDGFILDLANADDSTYPPLLTSGLIDLAHCSWGRIGTRILKRSWSHPRLDLPRMRREGPLADWTSRRLRPKVIVATQTRVLECLPDPRGQFLPVTPLLSAFPKQPADLWLLAAAIASPIATAHAIEHFGGAGLNPDAIKLSAKQLLTLPIPTNATHWQLAATTFQHATNAPTTQRPQLLHLFAEQIALAYEPTSPIEPLIRWWTSRLPPTNTEHTTASP